MKSFYLTFALVVLCFFAMSVALAQFEDPVVVWEEDFEEYTQNSELEAIYRQFNILPGLSTEDSWSGLRSIKQDPGNSGQFLIDLDPVVNTNIDQLIVTYYFYDDATNTSNAKFAMSVAGLSTLGSWTAGSIEQMIAIGFHDHATYQIRVFPGDNFVSTGVSRSQGWRKMTMVIYNGEANYYMDDDHYGPLSYDEPASGFNSVRIGPSNVSNVNDTFFYDDILFETATSVGDWFLY